MEPFSHVGRIAVVAPAIVMLCLTGFSTAVSAKWADIDGIIGMGTTEFTVDEPVWLAIRPQPKAGKGAYYVFGIDVYGPDGSALELWRVNFHEDSVTRFDLVDMLERQEVSDGTASFQWTWAGSAAFWVDPGEGGPSTFTFAVEVLAVPPENDVLVIPAVAHAPGKRGSFFRSDVRIYNHLPVESGFTHDVRLTFLPSDGGQKQEADITVVAGKILVLRDVVHSVFGLDHAIGALRLDILGHPEDLLHVTSRTYHQDDDGGTWGQYVPAERLKDAAGPPDTTRFLLHLQKSEEFRSNVGFVEVLGLDAEIELEMIDDTGTTVADGNLVVPAGSHRQITDIFGFLGAPPADNVCLLVRVTNSGRVLSYASVVDNRTSDPVYIPSLDPNNQDRELTVPAAAAVNGVAGSRWRTDVRVLSWGEPTAVTVRFLPSDDSPPTSTVFPFAGMGPLAIDDVVSQLGVRGRGALELSVAEEDTIQFLHVTSRTYNLTEDGTYGQFIAAEDSIRAHSLGGSVIGIDGSPGFRSNFGMANTSETDSVRVEVILVSGEGVRLGSRVWVVPPQSQHQVNDVFAALGVAPQENCRIDFVPSSSNPSAGVHAYASVVDNRTGDAVYIPTRSHSWVDR